MDITAKVALLPNSNQNYCISKFLQPSASHLPSAGTVPAIKSAVYAVGDSKASPLILLSYSQTLHSNLFAPFHYLA